MKAKNCNRRQLFSLQIIWMSFVMQSFALRFACDIGQSATIWIWVSSAVSVWSVDQPQPITSLLATSCWRDPTKSKQLSTVAILGFQFELYHVVVPLSFLRSVSLTWLFTSLFSILSWSDLLQIPRKPAAFSVVVLCRIALREETGCQETRGE